MNSTGSKDIRNGRSIFLDRIYLLTGIKLNLDCNDKLITIPKKYCFLFQSREKEERIPLKEVITVVDNVLSRREEYGDVRLDKWGRFNHNYSFLVKNKSDQSPIIDELILDVIYQLGLENRIIWPENKKAAVCLTHDVDSFDGTSYLWLRKAFWLATSLKNFFKCRFDESKNWLQKINRWNNITKDPIFAFDRWMELEDDYGFRSTFYFMALKHTLSKEGRLYSYKDPKFRKVLKELSDGDWEIGLHGAYYSHLKWEYLKEQKRHLEEILNDEVLGCRHHFLRVRYPKSWLIYEKAGFKYCSNVGWDSGENGFRAGTCFPYQPICGENNEKIELWEIPFQLMDSNKIENPDAYINLFLNYLEKVKKVGGCLVLNFHQEHFDENEAPGVNVTYKKILNILSEDNQIFVTTMNDLYHYMSNLPL